MKKSISVIIPNFNGKQLLEEYLPYTFRALEQAAVEFEVLVVDDASKDDSIAFLETNYPSVRILKNPVNKGFSFSCNRGMYGAKHELLFFLNSDVMLEENYFEGLWKYFEREDTFGVMGKILEMNSEKIEVAARSLNHIGFKFKTDKLFYQKGNEEYTPTAFLSGANALIDAEKLRTLGGFDEIFSPYYSEDLDLGLRAWRVGWKCFYDHGSTCYHRGSFTTKTQCKKTQVKQIYFRNRFVVHAIHLDGHYLKLWFVQVLLFEVIPKLLMGKHWYLNSYVSFLKQSKAIKDSKKRLTYLMKERNSSISLFDLKRRVDKDLSQKNLVWL